MRPVTLWYRVALNGRLEYNHLEDGHACARQMRPTPKCKEHHTLWRHGEWQSELAYLTNQLPAKVVHLH